MHLNKAGPDRGKQIFFEHLNSAPVVDEAKNNPKATKGSQKKKTQDTKKPNKAKGSQSQKNELLEAGNNLRVPRPLPRKGRQ